MSSRARLPFSEHTAEHAQQQATCAQASPESGLPCRRSASEWLSGLPAQREMTPRGSGHPPLVPSASAGGALGSSPPSVSTGETPVQLLLTLVPDHPLSVPTLVLGSNLLSATVYLCHM